jgi:hypothetical protein
MPPEILNRLKRLEDLLSPKNILEEAYAFVINRGRNIDLIDLEEMEDEDDRYSFLQNKARSIGEEIVKDQEIFEKLLPELFKLKSHQLYNFGQGLALGCDNPLSIWSQLREQFKKLKTENKNAEVLSGFINQLSRTDRNLSESILDETMTDEVLKEVFPYLQASVHFTRKTFKRLNQSLEEGNAPLQTYRNIASSSDLGELTDNEFCELISVISRQLGGLDIALGMLRIRLFKNNRNKIKLDACFISLGRDLLLKVQFDRNQYDNNDYALSEIAKVCLVGNNAEKFAAKICANFMYSLVKYNIYFTDYPQLLNLLACRFPLVFLDGFYSEKALTGSNFQYRMLWEDFDPKESALSQIEDKTILDWCQKNSEFRFSIITEAAEAFYHQKELIEWTPLALSIINEAPNTINVLDKLRQRLTPMSWSGSLSEILQSRIKLIIDLQSHSNPIVKEWALQQEAHFREYIASEKERERSWRRNEDERFE